MSRSTGDFQGNFYLRALAGSLAWVASVSANLGVLRDFEASASVNSNLGACMTVYYNYYLWLWALGSVLGLGVVWAVGLV